MYSEHSKIEALRKNEDWADTREYLKVFLFRMATAIGIAAVVLATGAIAQWLSIPIPLLRLAP